MPLLRPTDRAAPGADPRLTPELVVRAVRRGLAPRRARQIDRVVSRRLASVTVVLEDLYDPHNGAAVLRTCEALGLLHVHVIEARNPFAFSPKVTQRADRWLYVYQHTSAQACLSWLQGLGFYCLATVPPRRAAGPGAAAPLAPAGARPTALVLGNEHAGLSAAAVSLCPGRLSLPMQGFSESLNLSVCAAVLLQELTTARRRHLGRAGDLGPQARRQVRADYHARSTRHAASLVLGELRRQEAASR